MLLAVFMDLTRKRVHHRPIILLFVSGLGEGPFRNFKRAAYDIFRSDNLPFPGPRNVLKCLILHLLDQGFGSLHAKGSRLERL